MFNPYDYYITPEEYEIAEMNGISRRCVEKRIRSRGWDKYRAITQRPKSCIDRSEIRKVAIAHGITYERLMNRISKGWNEHRAATTPVWDSALFRDHMCRVKEMNRKYPKELIDLAESNGISARMFRHRASRGWEYLRAATLPTSPSNASMRVKELYGEDFFKRLMKWVFLPSAKSTTQMLTKR